MLVSHRVDRDWVPCGQICTGVVLPPTLLGYSVLISSFYRCYILPMKCSISLTSQHVNISSVCRLGTSSLVRYFAVYRVKTLPFQYGCIPHTILYSKYRYYKPTPYSSNLGLFTRSSLGAVFYESLPIQELSTSLCTCSHSFTLKMEAIRSSERSVLIKATRRHLPEDDNHHRVF
jgi:hypothetical protein